MSLKQGPDGKLEESEKERSEEELTAEVKEEVKG